MNFCFQTKCCIKATFIYLYPLFFSNKYLILIIMKSILALLSVVLLINLTACDSQTEKTSSDASSNFDFTGQVQEVIQTSNYTYCFVKENMNESWIAVSKMEVSAGQTLYYNQGLEMNDFHSKELDRTFPSVFFVQKASTNPNDPTNVHAPVKDKLEMGQTPVKPKIEKKDYSVEKAEGGITIAELYANKDKYAGKKVMVRGKITKFSAAIMNKNWAHIQDGTESNGDFDLTVTTLEGVNVDAVVTFEGVITLDKDFGAGYFYPVIMEDAVIIQ